MTDTIEGTVVDDDLPFDAAPPQPTVAITRRSRTSEVIRPLPTDALIGAMQEYQEMLPRLLAESDYQDIGGGKRFVKKSGWRKIAAAFDLDVQIVKSFVERDTITGKPLRAEVIARAISPSGRTMDGDGYCDVDEERFGKAGEADWKIAKARAKLENDLRATATTRAKNRAISDLVGMGEVSAEEADTEPATPPAAAALPAWAQSIPDAEFERLRLALGALLDVDDMASEVEDVIARLEKDTGGPIVKVQARAILWAAAAARVTRTSEPEPDTTPTPPSDPYGSTPPDPATVTDGSAAEDAEMAERAEQAVAEMRRADGTASTDEIGF